jgi:4-hydroxy-3-polyprenylbenzoate decarboxylase
VRRVVVGISGASGAIYGVRLLEVLGGLDDVETHAVITRGAATTLDHETRRKVADVEALADVVHDDADLGATIASGSFRVDGMVVAPCSIKTLSSIANCTDDSLLVRAADVRLKERQPLVLLLRESPLHRGHLRLMTIAAESGAVIMPAVTAMYVQPATVADLVDHTVMRVCDQLGVETDLAPRWAGLADAFADDPAIEERQEQ